MMDAGAIAQTIQLSVTPVFLLVATGSLLNVFTGRLARVIDRSRVLMERWAETEGLEHERIVAELRSKGRVERGWLGQGNIGPLAGIDVRWANNEERRLFVELLSHLE